MERLLQITADGSQTIAVPNMHVTYHSIHGAVQESSHVFIETGLQPLMHRYEAIRIFEMGFGTGLNALLSLQQSIIHHKKIFYHSAELYPLRPHEYTALDYAAQLQDDTLQPYLMQMHKTAWEEDIALHPLFTLHKTKQSIIDFFAELPFNLIYFDAFAPAAQPELWTRFMFEKMYRVLLPGGVLVTYCSKGDVRRAMLAAGFKVEKLPGPPRKREMLRCEK